MKEFFKDFRDPKFWASVCAWMAPISIAILWAVGIKYCWTRSEIGTFIAAIAGPFAGLAGFLYIYVNFIEQQAQFRQQQNLILKETFENSYFQLLNNFKNSFTNEFRGGWRRDIFTRINALLFSNNPDGYGGFIPNQTRQFRDLTFEEIFTQLNSMEGNLIRSLKAEFSPLLSVLFHIEDQIERNSHYLRTLIYSINHNDKFIFFYSFLANHERFSAEEKRVLKIFFREFPIETFLDPSHQDFLNSIT